MIGIKRENRRPGNLYNHLRSDRKKNVQSECLYIEHRLLVALVKADITIIKKCYFL